MRGRPAEVLAISGRFAGRFDKIAPMKAVDFRPPLSGLRGLEFLTIGWEGNAAASAWEWRKVPLLMARVPESDLSQTSMSGWGLLGASRAAVGRGEQGEGVCSRWEPATLE